MKVKTITITIELNDDDSLADVGRHLAELGALEASRDALPAEEKPSPGPDAQPKLKRKRLTRAEIDADEAAAAEADRQEAAAVEKHEQADPERTMSRGARRAAAAAKKGNPMEAAAGTAGRRSRRAAATASTAKSPSDKDISDEDVMKAASEAARELTPKHVMDRLEEFGVNNAAELSSTQRQKFVSTLQKNLDAERKANA